MRMQAGTELEPELINIESENAFHTPRHDFFSLDAGALKLRGGRALLSHRPRERRPRHLRPDYSRHLRPETRPERLGGFGLRGKGNDGRPRPANFTPHNHTQDPHFLRDTPQGGRRAGDFELPGACEPASGNGQADCFCLGALKGARVQTGRATSTIVPRFCDPPQSRNGSRYVGGARPEAARPRPRAIQRNTLFQAEYGGVGAPGGRYQKRWAL